MCELREEEGLRIFTLNLAYPWDPYIYNSYINRIPCFWVFDSDVYGLLGSKYSVKKPKNYIVSDEAAHVTGGFNGCIKHILIWARQNCVTENKKIYQVYKSIKKNQYNAQHACAVLCSVRASLTMLILLTIWIEHKKE